MPHRPDPAPDPAAEEGSPEQAPDPGLGAAVNPDDPADPGHLIITSMRYPPPEPGTATSAAGPGLPTILRAAPAPQADVPAGGGGNEAASKVTGPPWPIGEAPGHHPPPRPGPLRRALSHLNREDRPLVRDALLAVVVLVTGFCATFWLEGRISSQQQALDDSRAERQEVLENTRFIREVVLNPDARVQPFQRLNLAGASLAGLDLDCRTREDVATVQVVAGGGDSCANLSYANLTGADLYSANLFGSDLSGADLSYANLRSAQLLNADLSYVDLTGADLSYADIFGNARLVEANLTGADLRGANLSGANLTGANLTGANLTGANLSSIYGTNPTPDNSYATLTGATLTDICHDQQTEWPAGFNPPLPNCTEW